MPVLTKIAPIGIDWYIQSTQEQLYAALMSSWGDVKYNCYGRCYRNQTKDGYVAEVYTGEKDYKEVYWDDSLDALSFFGLSGNIKVGMQHIAPVHLVFFVNLKRLKPSVIHRPDEEVRADVIRVLGKNAFGLSFQSMDLWLENVLREYPGSVRDKRLKFVDMHPVHCFRLNYNLVFNPSKIC